MLEVAVRKVEPTDYEEWLRMRHALWPASSGHEDDHDADIRRYFNEPSEQVLTFIAEVENRLVGFLELDHRKYAPGCDSSPVPFIEGWYVDPDMRGRGVGRALVAAAETWARASGHTEIGSDADIANLDGIAAHAALGYEEVERLVCFRRSLSDA